MNPFKKQIMRHGRISDSNKSHKCMLSFRSQEETQKYSAGQSLASLLRTNRLALGVRTFIRRGIWPSARITLRVNTLINTCVVVRRVSVRIIALKQLQPRRYMPGIVQNLRLIDIYPTIVDANVFKSHICTRTFVFLLIVGLALQWHPICNA